jgi:hypothetical protein
MQAIGGQHETHVLAVDSQGNGLRIPKETPASVLEAMVTPNGGENIESDAFMDQASDPSQ